MKTASKIVLVAFFAFLLLSFFHCARAHSYQSRLDVHGTERVKEYSHIVYKISQEYEIPIDVLVGIAYNESNMRPFVVGDVGYAFSFTQIRCATDGKRFSWMPFLNEKGIEVNKCEDLLDPVVSMRATAEILVHHKKREKSWAKTIKAFHLGIFWKKQPTRAHSYLNRVRYFGGKLEKVVKENGPPRIIMSKINDALNKALEVVVKKIQTHFKFA